MWLANRVSIAEIEEIFLETWGDQNEIKAHQVKVVGTGAGQHEDDAAAVLGHL